MAGFSWVDLPMIFVERNPFVVEAPNSYGLIVYARDTRRWFMVKRRHSHYLILILRGCFVTANIPEFVAGLINDEAFHLSQCLESMEYLQQYIMETFQEEKTITLKLIWGRFQECKAIFQSCLSLRDANINDNEWGWVKGRQISIPSKKYLESGQDAAFREFEEESGINLLTSAKNLIISTKTFQFSMTGNFGRNYTSHFWICLIDHEIHPPAEFKDYIEVSERAWLSKHEVEDKIDKKLQSFFRTVESYVDKKILRYSN